jgi:hypothetical protein
VGTIQPFSLAGPYKRARGCETSIMGGRMVPFPNHGISGGRATSILLVPSSPTLQKALKESEGTDPFNPRSMAKNALTR